MSESAAICIYVADRYCPGSLAPAIDEPSRGKSLYWTLYTPAVVEPAMSETFNKVEANRVRSGWGDFDLMIKTFDEGLAGKEWILGEPFSAADVMLGSSAVFMRMFEMLPDTKHIGAYADRCMARPAFQKATEKSSA
jgi:glutathione S-transferase